MTKIKVIIKPDRKPAPREFTHTNARSTIATGSLSSSVPTVGHVSTTKKP